MARFRYCNRLLLFPIMFGLPILCCQCGYSSYSGTAVLSEHPWLKHKRIFLDPGHGGEELREIAAPTACPSPR